ncbi:ACP S-malonyltransferase [Ramlibacter sp.]|uniref:ACP S-malonyltransferase n=1 Tax=Ramlibacter sp. TaxID=1917967 RepID=UPI0017C963DF|nr:ACP S-malonyltransferase [Ramlibacter sp.]MBA2674235.1 ACP S-malonyltransferase [Ramlibacter sp.]
MKPFAFVFPGQGSQSVGMLDAWGDHPAVAETLREASDALGDDVARLMKEGPKEALALTTNAQPVMLAAGVAAWRAWLAEGGAEPAVMAGHSLGEYSALVASGALALGDAMPLVRFRAEAMQQAVPVGEGAMAAILGLAAQDVIDGCADTVRSFGLNTDEAVEAVNFNSPVQTVIAGSKAAVERACEALKARGAKSAVMLQVSAPFHSSLMKPAAEKLKERLAATPLAAPRIPVVNNIEAKAESEADRIRAALYEQAYGPVRWVDCMRAIKALGPALVIECGPGKVLAGLARRIDPEMVGVPLYDPATLANAKELLA